MFGDAISRLFGKVTVVLSSTEASGGVLAQIYIFQFCFIYPIRGDKEISPRG